MLLCRVDGNAIATVHHPSLRGWRQLICQPLDVEGFDIGKPILVADSLGAGLHDRVLVTSDGKSIRERVGSPLTPLRYMSIAILDIESQEKGHAA
ncbi:MAG: EutN/CcmL family microcompartment protein [Verrucomicrobia bacterium]|nr:EutN/CcmL family microcompartment protein [Verrucomicrobiota bacterium]